MCEPPAPHCLFCTAHRPPIPLGCLCRLQEKRAVQVALWGFVPYTESERNPVITVSPPRGTVSDASGKEEEAVYSDDDGRFSFPWQLYQSFHERGRQSVSPQEKAQTAHSHRQEWPTLHGLLTRPRHRLRQLDLRDVSTQPAPGSWHLPWGVHGDHGFLLQHVRYAHLHCDRA